MSQKTATNTAAKANNFVPANGVLQRKCACGNHTSAGGECSSCSAKKVQKKLSIGATNDPLELEADHVAEQVLANKPTHSFGNISAPKIQRRAENSSEQTEEVPASVERVLASSGSPLPISVRKDMEQRFGQDFSQVRMHTGSTAEQSASDVNANAYTVGNNIVFNRGKFSPETQSGKRLLAHELTHVVQQSGLEGIRFGQTEGKHALPSIHPNDRGETVRRDESEEDLKRKRKMMFKDMPPPNASFFDASPPSKGPTSVAHKPLNNGSSHRTPPGLGPNPTLEQVIAASNVDPHRAAAKVDKPIATESRSYQQIKDSIYKALVDAAVGARRAAIKQLRALAMKLPSSLQPLALTLVETVNDQLQIAFNFVFFVLGVVVGLGEGIFDLVKGVLQIAYALIKFLADLLTAVLGKPDLLEADLKAVKAFLDNFWPGIKQLFSDWTTKLSNAPQERQSAMIGELVGQIVAFIVTWEASASKLSKLPQLTAKVPIPVLAEAVQTGVRMPIGQAVPITVDLGKLGSQAGAAGLTTVQAVALGSNGQQATTGTTSGGSGGGSGAGRGSRATISSSETTLPGGKVVIKSEGRVGEAPMARPGLEKKYPLGKAAGLPGYVRFHVEGIKAIGEELNVVYAPERFNISETALIENQIRVWQAEVKATGGELMFEFTAKCRIQGEFEGVRIKVLEEITWKIERRLPGSDTFKPVFEHVGKP